MITTLSRRPRVSALDMALSEAQNLEIEDALGRRRTSPPWCGGDGGAEDGRADEGEAVVVNNAHDGREG